MVSKGQGRGIKSVRLVYYSGRVSELDGTGWDGMHGNNATLDAVG
jgi:hypothetical protein